MTSFANTKCAFCPDVAIINIGDGFNVNIPLCEWHLEQYFEPELNSTVEAVEEWISTGAPPKKMPAKRTYEVRGVYKTDEEKEG